MRLFQESTRSRVEVVLLALLAVCGLWYIVLNFKCSRKSDLPRVTVFRTMEITVPAGVSSKEWKGFESISYRGRDPIVWRFRARSTALPGAEIYIQELPVSRTRSLMSTGIAENWFRTYYPLRRLKPRRGVPVSAPSWTHIGTVPAYGQVLSIDSQHFYGMFILKFEQDLYMLYFTLPAAVSPEQRGAKEAMQTLLDSLRRK